MSPETSGSESVKRGGALASGGGQLGRGHQGGAAQNHNTTFENQQSNHQQQHQLESSTTENSPGETSRSGSAGSKMMGIRVRMLDDSITLFQVQTKAPGKILFDQVCKQLNLLEVDYFGLEYKDSQNVTYWLDLDKQMNHQVGLFPISVCHDSTNPTNTTSDPILSFCVKFYTPDPAQIEEEYTRYLFSLQIKRDLATGQLQCNDNTSALMASYIVQAECGDYVAEDYPDHTYLSGYKFIPQQNPDLERRIMENHKKHTGQSPAEADLNLLETARRCELYGTKMHFAKDHEGVPLNIAVVHLGVHVFQGYTKINGFSWAKVRKLSFKRKKFLIKLHPEGYPEGYYKDTVEFYFEDRNHCKNFWKKCVEHHTFFRCSATIQKEREKRRILSRGSSFRYSGKTQKQMQEYVRENFVKRQSFQRSQTRNIHSSLGDVGQNISVHPLLPIGDNGVAGQPFSLSCGAMTFHQDSELEIKPFQDHQQRHQSANNTPHRASKSSRGFNSNPAVSFGYATLATPYTHSNDTSIITTESNMYRRSLGDGDSFNNSSVSFDGRRGSEPHQIDTQNMVPAIVDPGSIQTHHMRPNNYVNDPDLLMVSGSQFTSEDNLSHESYDLIEKDEELVVIETISTNTTATVNSNNSGFDNSSLPKPSADANKFEQEFYRQAAAQGAINSGSSMGSLVIHSPSPKIFADGTTQNTNETATKPILKQPVKRKTSTSSAHSNQSQPQSGSRNSLAEYCDIVRPQNTKTTPETIKNPTVVGATTQLQSQTLPRIPKRGMNESSKYYVNTYNLGASNLASRTLPYRRREKSPVFYTRGRLTGAGNEISSASSSSHASPQIIRPKSLDFAVVSASALPNKNAFSYQDDTINDQPSSLQQPVEYEDSSSAVSGMNELNYASSSDVAQTPEMPNVLFQGLSLSGISGAETISFGLEDTSVYFSDERIYDVPEGIEGVTLPVTVKIDSLIESSAPPVPPHLSKNPITIRGINRSIEKPPKSEKPQKLPIRLPPPNLLPSMSSTESESAFSARSAPTPVGNAELLQPQLSSEISIDQPSNVDLISPPDPDESESTPVLDDSRNVPAPPEFSGADIIQSQDNKEDTDVEDDLSTSRKINTISLDESNVDLESSPMNEEISDSTIRKRQARASQDDSTVAHVVEFEDEITGNDNEGGLSSMVTLESPPTVFGEENTEDSNGYRVAEMYFRLGNGSTISSNGDSDSVKNVEEVKSEPNISPPNPIPEDKTSESDSSIPLPPKDLLNVVSSRKKMLGQSSESSDGSLDIASIPPPVVEQSESNVDDEMGAQIEMPGPSTILQRTLSRISETSSTLSDNKEDNQMEPAKLEVAVEKIGEDEEDTLSDPNCTSSEENGDHASLNSDLPENAAQPGYDYQAKPERKVVANFNVADVIRECTAELGGEIEFNSPPSSHTEGNNTEITHLEGDSLFLEITPPEGQASLKDDEEVQKDKIPYDLSISSEKNVTNNEEDENANNNENFDDDASLHDSMEILEEVATEDHFETEQRNDSQDDENVFTDDCGIWGGYVPPPILSPQTSPKEESSSESSPDLAPGFSSTMDKCREEEPPVSFNPLTVSSQLPVNPVPEFYSDFSGYPEPRLSTSDSDRGSTSDIGGSQGSVIAVGVAGGNISQTTASAATSFDASSATPTTEIPILDHLVEAAACSSSAAASTPTSSAEPSPPIDNTKKKTPKSVVIETIVTEEVIL